MIGRLANIWETAPPTGNAKELYDNAVKYAENYRNLDDAGRDASEKWSLVKKALANCSPSRRVDSMMAKFSSDIRSPEIGDWRLATGDSGF